MPIDINSLRTYKGGDPDAYRRYMEQRFKDPAVVDRVLAKDEAWRELRGEIDKLRTSVNKLQASVASRFADFFARSRRGVRSGPPRTMPAGSR